MNKELLLIADFGAHNNQKVAKQARSAKVYCEVLPVEKLTAELKPKAIVAIGDDEAACDLSVLKSYNVPVLAEGNVKSNEEFLSFITSCGFKQDWTVESFIENAVEEIKKTVGDKKVLCALSGGVDSSVCAALVHRAIGDQLTCVFVDHGLMRKNEPESIEKIFKQTFKMNLIMIDAKERFLTKLAGVDDPEKKRKIIGEEFIRVFEEESAKLGKMDFLLQGTIYPDIIESFSKKGMVKSHHNVGGLPEDVDFQLLEPIKWLFKDEVRSVGTALGLPDEQVWRQPFPGPGLGVRVVGAITREKLAAVREADAIWREEIKNAGLDKQIWQYFAVCPGFKSTGVKDGRRTFAEAICLRAILSSDAMSAEVAQIPYELLRKVAVRVVAEVPGVNRVLYDITPKPPSTIEFE